MGRKMNAPLTPQVNWFLMVALDRIANWKFWGVKIIQGLFVPR